MTQFDRAGRVWSVDIWMYSHLLVRLYRNLEIQSW